MKELLTSNQRCGWFGEGRGQCLFSDGHKGHHTCEQDGWLLERATLGLQAVREAERRALKTPTPQFRKVGPLIDDLPSSYCGESLPEGTAVYVKLAPPLDQIIGDLSVETTCSGSGPLGSVTLTGEEFLALSAKEKELTEQLAHADAINSESVNIRCHLEHANRELGARVDRLRKRIHDAYDLLAAASSEDVMTADYAVKTSGDAP